MTTTPVIRVDAVRKTYGSTVAVEDVSFDVHPGETFGLIGPMAPARRRRSNASRDCACPTAGRPRLGLDPVRTIPAAAADWCAAPGGAPAEADQGPGSGRFLGLAVSTAVDGDRLLEQLGLSEKRNAWFMTLSGGQKQRLFIALALINDPELVFLDELTTGLDPQARRAIWDLVRGIRDRGKTVFLTTHLMEEAERLCDRVAILDHGRLVDIGTPAALVRRHCPERMVVVTTSTPARGTLFRQSRQSFGRRRGTAVHHSRQRRRPGDAGDSVPRRTSHDGDRFRTVVPTLEDVFLKLTGHLIRD